MCISGKIDRLSPWQNEILDRAIAFYQSCKGVIKKGHSRKVSPEILNPLAPEGYQAIVRRGENGQVLVTVHTFENTATKLEIPLPCEGLRLENAFHRSTVRATVQGKTLVLEGIEACEGAAFLLQ